MKEVNFYFFSKQFVNISSGFFFKKYIRAYYAYKHIMTIYQLWSIWGSLNILILILF